jgi:hypothetical protein
VVILAFKTACAKKRKYIRIPIFLILSPHDNPGVRILRNQDNVNSTLKCLFKKYLMKKEFNRWGRAYETYRFQGKFYFMCILISNENSSP